MSYFLYNFLHPVEYSRMLGVSNTTVVWGEPIKINIRFDRNNVELKNYV